MSSENSSVMPLGELAYDELREVLRNNYPDGEGVLPLRSFMEVETTLSMALEVSDAPVDPFRAHLLLAGWCLLRPERMDANGHLMQMARRRLMGLSSTLAWRAALEGYLDERLRGVRLYDCGGDAVARLEDPLGIASREAAYLSWIVERPHARRPARIAAAGKGYAYTSRPEQRGGGDATAEARRFTMPDVLPSPSEEPAVAPRKEPLPPIELTLDELCAAADDLSALTGEGRFAAVMRKVRDHGLLRKPDGRRSEDADGIEIARVVNLVGLVGSGKSTVTLCLAFALAKRGLRTLFLCNSVSDAMDGVRLMARAGIPASPLVSSRMRLEHLDEALRAHGRPLLDEVTARYLETPCVVDGLSTDVRDACSYDRAPCRALRDGAGRDKGVYVCPFWDVCPSQNMARDAATSLVVFTTPAGMTTMSARKDRVPFFETAVSEFDLVVFDESDRVQAQLDDQFAPQISFQRFIRDSADAAAAAMKRPSSQKMRDRNVEAYYDLRQDAEIVAKSLLQAVGAPGVQAWEAVRGRAFTSLTLLHDLEAGGLAEPLAHDLALLADRSARNPGGASFELVLARAFDGADDRGYRRALASYVSARTGGGEAPPSELLDRLGLAIKVARFDQYLRELADASEQMGARDGAVEELYSFLEFSHARQQRYLPRSAIGNLFGMRLTDDKDILLFRQFAYGRAFMNSLPWLETDASGRPLGPHALLLSGSSWEPGCLQYHINRPVDYLLLAEPWKQEVLSRSKISDLGIGRSVSGSAPDKRLDNLTIVLGQTAHALGGELGSPQGKALFIVNSYDEAREASDRLQALARKRGETHKVAALTRSPLDEGRALVPRSELPRFHDHPARVLVAPALAVERGHNITDRRGHATFSSLFFCVRPMGTPFDMKGQFRKLNGLVDRHVRELPDDPFRFAAELRASAWSYWRRIERASRVPLSRLRAIGEDELARDAVATLMVTIIQVYGRLARIEDRDREAPHVYFADGAFHGRDGDATVFRTLRELDAYLLELTERSDQTVVAHALYGPFYHAFKEGI